MKGDLIVEMPFSSMQLVDTFVYERKAIYVPDSCTIFGHPSTDLIMGILFFFFISLIPTYITNMITKQWYFSYSVLI